MRQLARFLHVQSASIVDAWSRHVASLPAVRAENLDDLCEQMPELVDELATALASDEPAASLAHVVVTHARERYAQGYDIREVVSEYQALRRAIMDAHLASGASGAAELATLSETIDLAIGASVDWFMAERDRARDIFVGILGHDVRGPLQTVMVAADMIADASEPSHPIVRRVGAPLRASAHRLGRMIDELLDFARTHFGGGIPIDPRPIDVRAVVREVIEEVADGHPGHEIIGEHAGAPSDFSACADQTRLAQAVANLVRNAVEYGRDPIVVALNDEGSSLRIDVSNTGTIAPEAAQRLFAPFALRTSHDRVRSRDGLGLGLFIVAEIARAHGGMAWLASSDQDRVTFSVRIQKSRVAPTTT